MKKARRGAMFLEVCIAVVVIAAACIAVAQLLVVVGHQQRVLDQQRMAIAEAANLMEQALVLSWDELTEERLAELSLPPGAADDLGGEARFELVETSEPLEAKQVRLSLIWSDYAGQRNQPVQLTAWKYRVEGTP
jgi:hypothetical protein